MSLFGDLYVGTSGLQTSQEALNVVAHNITNTDTAGYVRQQVTQNTRDYNRLSISTTGVGMKQTGLGVYVGEVRQVRDRFLDLSYREEIGRQGFYDTAYDAIQEIEEILGEMDGATFYESMNSLWTSIEELVKDPSSEVCQSMLVQYAQSFVEASGNVYNSMSNYQDKLDVKVRESVDRINELGAKIYKLNEQIRAIEVGGVENPNDLKDQRNQLIDELSNLAKISYNEDFYGNILIKLEGHDFVTMNQVNEIGYQVNKDSGFLDVFWPDLAKHYDDANGNRVYRPETAPVFNYEIAISSTIDTDLGVLKSALLARGDHRGNWTDLESAGAYKDVKDSVMMNVMAEFDGLVHHVVTAVNDVLKKSAENATQNVDSNSKYLRDADGNPIQLFTRTSCNDTTRPEIVRDADVKPAGQPGSFEMDATGQYKLVKSVNGSDKVYYEGSYTRNPETGDYIADSTAWFSIENLAVNEDLLQYPTHLGFVGPDGSVDYTTAKALETAFQEQVYTLNPELTNPISITEYYANLVAQLSNSGNIYKSLASNQALTVESVEAQRQGNMGVSTDEELSNMIRYQNAYNASSRFINVINECTEHLINTLGR